MNVFSIFIFPPVALLISIVINYFFLEFFGFQSEELLLFVSTCFRLYFKTIGSYTLFFIVLLFVLGRKDREGEGYSKLINRFIFAIVCGIIGIILTIILQIIYNEITFNNYKTHILKFSIFFFYSPILIFLDYFLEYILGLFKKQNDVV